MLHWATPHMSVDLSNANAKKVQELASSFNCRNTSPESSSVRLVTACFDSVISSAFLLIFPSTRLLANIWGQGLTISTLSEKAFSF